MVEKKLPSVRNISIARDVFSRPEYKSTPALFIWQVIANIAPENFHNKEDADWFVGLGLQLVQTFSHMSKSQLEELGIDVIDIAQKTDEVYKKFYPGT